jgi:hypothetical protein
MPTNRIEDVREPTRTTSPAINSHNRQVVESTRNIIPEVRSTNILCLNDDAMSPPRGRKCMTRFPTTMSSARRMSATLYFALRAVAISLEIKLRRLAIKSICERLVNFHIDHVGNRMYGAVTKHHVHCVIVSAAP